MCIENFDSKINCVVFWKNETNINQWSIMANIALLTHYRITISIRNHVTKKQHQKDISSSSSSSWLSASQWRALKWIRSKIQQDLQLWSTCRLWPLDWHRIAAVWSMKKGKWCCLHLSHCSRPISDTQGPLIQEDSSTTSCTKKSLLFNRKTQFSQKFIIH